MRVALRRVSNGHQNVLYLSKEIGSMMGTLPNPGPTVTGIPTWGFAINNKDRGLRITFTDLISQPTTTWSWASWPNVREIFSINTDRVESFSNMFVSRWLGNGGNLTIEGEFRVKDINGKSQFLIDNFFFSASFIWFSKARL